MHNLFGYIAVGDYVKGTCVEIARAQALNDEVAGVYMGLLGKNTIGILTSLNYPYTRRARVQMPKPSESIYFAGYGGRTPYYVFPCILDTAVLLKKADMKSLLLSRLYRNTKLRITPFLQGGEVTPPNYLEWM